MKNDFLEHYGVPGMRWGVRKNRVYTTRHSGKPNVKYFNNSSSKKKSNLKRNLAIGAGVATVALAAYGGYRYSKFIKDKNVEIAIERGKKIC